MSSTIQSTNQHTYFVAKFYDKPKFIMWYMILYIWFLSGLVYYKTIAGVVKHERG